MKQIDKNELENYINKTFGNICIMAVQFGWIYGSSDNKNIDFIEKLGLGICYLYKISYDYENLEKDILENNNYSINYVLNVGIQESFEKFMECKNIVIELCMRLDIYSNTMKEIIDLFEEKIDNFMEKTDKDLRSHYTLSSNK